MLYLREMNLKDSRQEYEFFIKLPQEENGFVNPYFNISYLEFVNTEIAKRIQDSKSMEIRNNHVPETYYFLWKDYDIIGLYKVRHFLTEELKNGSGHIGYAILPSERGKGYGTKGLAMVLEKARDIITEDEFYLCCNQDNSCSLKVMLHNQAYIHHRDNPYIYARIKKE